MNDEETTLWVLCAVKDLRASEHSNTRERNYTGAWLSPVMCLPVVHLVAEAHTEGRWRGADEAKLSAVTRISS